MPTCNRCHNAYRFTAAEIAMDPRPPYECPACRPKPLTDADHERIYDAAVDAYDGTGSQPYWAALTPRERAEVRQINLRTIQMGKSR